MVRCLLLNQIKVASQISKQIKHYCDTGIGRWQAHNAARRYQSYDGSINQICLALIDDNNDNNEAEPVSTVVRTLSYHYY